MPVQQVHSSSLARAYARMLVCPRCAHGLLLPWSTATRAAVAIPPPTRSPNRIQAFASVPKGGTSQSGRPVAPTGLYSALATLPCVGVHFAQPYRTIALSIHGNNPCKDQPKRLTVFPFGNQSGALTAAHVRLGSLKSSPQPHRQRPLYATPSMQCRRAYIPASTRESN
jgi:hypothetical protein